MLRKLTFIAMAVVLGLALFAGCSNDAVTSTDSGAEEAKSTYTLSGTVSDSSGEPVEGALIVVTKGLKSWYDYSDENGDYGVTMTNGGNGWYGSICYKYGGSLLPNLTYNFYIPPNNHYHNFNFM